MKDVLETILGKTIDDIVLTGVVDTEEEPAVFIPLLHRVFLDVGGSLVEIVRDEASVRLTVSIVENVRVSCELEEGFLKCRSSIGKYVLVDPMADNRIVRIVIYQDKGGAYEAIEFVLQSGQMIFFDPSFFEGINFGGVEQKGVWRANSDAYKAITIE